MDGLHIHLMFDNINDHNNSGYWMEYHMPHYPSGYVPEFSRPIMDSSIIGGEVVVTMSTIIRRVTRTTMECAASERYHKLGMSVIPPPSPDQDTIIGLGLYHALSPRLQSVISRSCAVVAGNDLSSEFQQHVADVSKCEIFLAIMPVGADTKTLPTQNFVSAFW